MDERTQNEYNAILAHIVAVRGYVTLPRDQYTVYSQYDYTDHFRRCGVASHNPPCEDSWGEFLGTFCDDNTVHGVIMSNVTCNCGEYTGRTIRWVARVSEIAEAVFTELYNRTIGRTA